MSVTAYFNADSDSAEGIKREFLATVDDAFDRCISNLQAFEGDDTVPSGVKFETDSDVQAIQTEAQWFLSAEYDEVGVVVAE